MTEDMPGVPLATPIIDEFLQMRRAFLLSGLEIEKIRPFAMLKAEAKRLEAEVPLAQYCTHPGQILKIAGLRAYVVDELGGW